MNYHETRPKVKIVGCGGKGSDSGEGTGAGSGTGSGAGSGETPEAVEGAKRPKPPNWDAMTRNQKQYCTGVKGTGGEMLWKNRPFSELLPGPVFVLKNTLGSLFDITVRW